MLGLHEQGQLWGGEAEWSLSSGTLPSLVTAPQTNKLDPGVKPNTTNSLQGDLEQRVLSPTFFACCCDFDHRMWYWVQALGTVLGGSGPSVNSCYCYMPSSNSHRYMVDSTIIIFF